MMETTVVLKPPEQWRAKNRWYSSWAPDWLKGIFRHVWPDTISYEELIDEMDRAMQIPGNTNAWTMPIKGRIDMLSTGVRTPVGIKILGSIFRKYKRTGEALEKIMRIVPGTRSVYAERVAGGYFVDFIPRREALARYGLTIDDLQSVIMSCHRRRNNYNDRRGPGTLLHQPALSPGPARQILISWSGCLSPHGRCAGAHG